MGNQPDNPGLHKQPTVSTVLRDYWPVVAAGLLFIALQWPVLVNWWGVWFEKDSYYSHGPLVPLIAAFMIWTARGRLARSPVEPSWAGLFLLLLFLPVHAIGILMELRVLYGLAFLMCLYGVTLLLFGRRVTKILFIPLLFLVTMMPIASWMLDNATGQFQLVSATVATKFLQLTSGHEVVQYGNTIASPGLPDPGTLLVGSPCSGLRLLISLITFSWFFVYVTKGAWWKKAFLLTLSFPLSIFINSLRVTMIGYAGFWTGSSEAMHKFHDYSGYIGLVICFVILFGIAKLIGMGDLQTSSGNEEQPSSVSKDWPKPVGAGLPGVAALVLLGIGTVASFTLQPLYALPKGHLDRADIPRSFGSWSSTVLPIDEGTSRILNKGDLMSLLYVDDVATGRQVQVFLDAGVGTAAFHDPHLCLPGGGSPITEDIIITLHFAEPEPTMVRATMLQASNGYSGSLVIYWYTAGSQSLPRTSDVVDANRRDKLSDFMRVILSPQNLPALRQEVRSRQYVWYRFSTEVLDEENDEAFLRSFVKDFIANYKGFGKPVR